MCVPSLEAVVCVVVVEDVWRVAVSPTSSLAEMVEAGVLGSELGEVAVPTPELGESPSPATSWISFARMARSLARSWLSLQGKHKEKTDVTERPTKSRWTDLS